MDTDVILTVVVICLAFFGEAIFGFGGGLISVPLLTLILGVRDGVTLALVFQTLMGILIFKAHRDISWKAAKPMTFTLILGAGLGTLLLSSVNIVALQLFLATMIIVFLVKSIWFSGLNLKKYGSDGAHAAGFTGGLFQGVIGVGGPIVTMYLSAILKDKSALRATLIYLLFITCIARIIMSIPQGLFNNEVLQLVMIALPFFLVAIFFGQRLFERINATYYRTGIHMILAGSAIALLIKAMS